MHRKLLYKHSVFIFSCGFDDRHIPKNAGFKWNVNAKEWYTSNPAVAVKLCEYADFSAKEKIDATTIKISPWLKPLPSLPPNLELLPHQKEAIYFSLSRNHSYLGLDPGLGKTICAAVIAATLNVTTVYVTPPFLVRNVDDEFKKWAPELKTTIINAKSKIDFLTPVVIVPDSIIGRDYLMGKLMAWAASDPKKEALIIVDECHRFKNPEALRTQAVMGLARSFKRRIFMSGTPMPNRPMELFTILSEAAPETILYMNKFEYGRRYCAGFADSRGHWDFSGASNVEELAKAVIHPHGPFMLRQRKALLNLPPKLEQTVTLKNPITVELRRLEKKIREQYPTAEKLLRQQLADDAEKSSAELHVATYRRLLGEHKAPLSAELIRDVLTETDENVLVFAYHKLVVAKLAEFLKDFEPLVITGDTPVDERHGLVKKFQTSDTKRLFIGNYLSMGVGFTLTRATRVIFVEYDWTPGVNDQASDRAHRIGQNESVLVEYHVYQDSLDKAVLETILRKRESINKI